MARSGKTPAGQARKKADALGVWIAIGAGVVIGVVTCRHPDGGHREGEEAT